MAQTKTWNGSDTSWNTAANWSPTGVPQAGDVVVLDASNSQDCTLDADTAQLGSLTIADGYAGTFDAAGYDVQTTGDVSLACSGGTVSMGSGVWTVGGGFDYRDAGTFNADTSTLKMTGAGDLRVNTGAYSLNVLTIEAGAAVSAVAKLAVIGGCTIDGTLTAGEGVILLFDECALEIGVGGKLTGPGTARLLDATAPNQGLVSLDGVVDVAVLDIYRPNAAAEPLAPGQYDSALVRVQTPYAGKTLVMSAGDYLFAGDFELTTTETGTLTLDNDANDPDITVSGNIIIDDSGGAVTWTKGSGAITISGSGDQSIDFDGQAIEELRIAKSGGTATFEAGFTCDSLLATGGTLDFGGQSVIAIGAFKIEPGAAIAAGNDAMNGAAIACGSLDLTGQSGALLNLRATVAWTLIVAGAAMARYCDVSYCDASGGTTITPPNSIDGGNNANWLFATGGPYAVDEAELSQPGAMIGETFATGAEAGMIHA